MRYFGLIGFPLGHSFSKQYFTDFFEENDIKAEYELYPLENISEFKQLIEQKEFSGLNVTIPYKTKVIQYLDELDETAAEVGAVNVIQFIRKDNKTILKGYNSDVVGFENSLLPYLKKEHQKALILGTGGASKAVFYVMKKLDIEASFVSRTPSDEILSYEELNADIIKDNLLIINTTPLGMSPNINTCPDIPYEHITENHLIYDLIYSPAETLFMQKAAKQGAVVVNGMEMLYGQAESAWKQWSIVNG